MAINVNELKKQGLVEKDIEFLKNNPEVLDDAVIVEEPEEKEVLELEGYLREAFPKEQLAKEARLFKENIKTCRHALEKIYGAAVMGEFLAGINMINYFAQKGDYYKVAKIALELRSIKPIK